LTLANDTRHIQVSSVVCTGLLGQFEKLTTHDVKLDEEDLCPPPPAIILGTTAMSAVTFPPPPPPKVFVDRNAVEVVQYRLETYGGKRKPGGMVRYDVHLLRAEDELRQGLQAQPGRAESALGRVLAETRQASIHKSGERKMEEKKEKRKALEVSQRYHQIRIMHRSSDISIANTRAACAEEAEDLEEAEGAAEEAASICVRMNSTLVMFPRLIET